MQPVLRKAVDALLSAAQVDLFWDSCIVQDSSKSDSGVCRQLCLPFRQESFQICSRLLSTECRRSLSSIMPVQALIAFALNPFFAVLGFCQQD